MDLDLLICNDSVQVHKQFRLPKDARHPLWADVNASDFKCELRHVSMIKSRRPINDESIKASVDIGHSSELA